MCVCVCVHVWVCVCMRACMCVCVQVHVCVLPWRVRVMACMNQKKKLAPDRGSLNPAANLILNAQRKYVIICSMYTN